MDKVLITGATGFLGGHCLAPLVARAGEIHALARTSVALTNAGIHAHSVDLLDLEQVSVLMSEIRPTHLLHLAWIATPGIYWTSPENTRWAAAGEHLMHAFAAHGGRRAVFAGSCAEYDWNAGRCHETTTPLRPASSYGASKNRLRLRVEAIARETGLSAAWGRMFFLYGPHEHPERLVASVIRSLLNGVPARCSSGAQERDFLHVQDAADAFVALLASAVEGPVNIASGQAVAIRDVVTNIAAQLGRPDLLRLGALPANPTDPPCVVADVTRLHEEVGWTPRFNLAEGLADTVSWWEKKLTQPKAPAKASARASASGSPRCPICGGATREFLRRAAVPAHQNVLLADADAARNVSRGQLVMHQCLSCGFGFNAAFDPALLNYGANYDNSQNCSEAFNHYLDALVRDLMEVHGVRHCRIVEVGCGNGEFLKKLVAHPGSGNRGVGFDPAYCGPLSDLNGRACFFRHVYDQRAIDAAADVVICRHVIEHVPAPLELLRAIRQALTGAMGARIFLETPSLEWILRHQVLWDFFYEHCSLFTAAALRLAMTRAGFEVVSCRSVFEQQYWWLEGKVAEAGSRWSPGTDPTAALALGLAKQEDQRRRGWQLQLQQWHGAGPVVLWGAGAKGVTFCNLADPECQRLACVVDVNPAKQGKFVAGTGHRIISPEELTAHRPAAVLVLNPNYLPEIAERLAGQDSPAAVINLMQEQAVPRIDGAFLPRRP
jgi:nucleoside-diphosphate-sugar epimerase/SAM-dependent methyltransferase